MAPVAVCLGCGSGEPPAVQKAAVAAVRPAPTVELRLVDHGEIEAERARHAGKVVVLDCWSTSCPPCVREFPGLVRLQERFGDQVACISLSFDYEGIGSPEDAVPRVSGFLEEVGAGGITNLMSREDADVVSRKMEIVSVPAVFVWNRDGSLAQRFDDEQSAKELGRAFTYDDVTAAVEACLAR